MTGTGYVFQRREVKFRVSAEQRKEFLRMVSDYMHPDTYGESTVFSLYCDTADFRLMRRSAEHPLYKEKLRIRCYGQPTDESTVYLEIKKKYDGIVYKRRLSLAYYDCKRFAEGDISVLPDTQIGREIAYFTHVYPGISPRILVCYERSAFFANADETVRVTFDRDVRCRFTDTEPHLGADGKRLFPDDSEVMELKYAGALPKFISDALTVCRIKPFSFSKCGTAYINEYLRRENNA